MNLVFQVRDGHWRLCRFTADGAVETVYLSGDIADAFAEYLEGYPRG